MANEAGERCAAEDAIAQCAGLEPGDVCANGRCYATMPGPACLAAVCGNGFFEDLDERCDDGNHWRRLRGRARAHTKCASARRRP